MVSLAQVRDKIIEKECKPLVTTAAILLESRDKWPYVDDARLQTNPAYVSGSRNRYRRYKYAQSTNTINNSDCFEARKSAHALRPLPPSDQVTLHFEDSADDIKA
jgi:hypothetical protein